MGLLDFLFMVLPYYPQYSIGANTHHFLPVNILCEIVQYKAYKFLKERCFLKDKVENDEPTIAPGMNTHDPLEEKATDEEIEKGDTTSVTRLYLDRTPED